jgi:DNA-binding transcriptional ArsR family regulator
MSESLKIEDPKTAAAFGHPRRRRILLELAGREGSASEISAATDTPLSLLHHHLRQLLALNLIRIVRTRARPGRPVKYYRAVAKEFFLPAELIDQLPGAANTARLREALDKSQAARVAGVIYSSEDGRHRMRLVLDRDRGPLTIERWLELRLSDEDAAALAADLKEVLDRYALRTQPGRKAYIVHAALAPA